ncbi:major facilitator superfamily domain-containing protein [Mycotypha africana]|uniref:major facilitator superfamily domain-containing protein n=1 Tax=Mycotypha africana TaxID=64632 RepID=UPI0023004F95|nr:major facilitator superfamily domain-containing protein [Mycotypha africana]KAI8973703.1 major facilitator superfamily domain-containing protein [Mycotypha africana]
MESSSSHRSLLHASNGTSFSAWIVLFFAVLLNMSINLRWSTFSPVASVAADYMQVNLSAITWLSNCATLIYIAIGFCTGWIFEKYGIKTSFILAAVTNIAGSWIRYFGTFAPVHQRYGIIMFGQCLASVAEPFIMNIGTHVTVSTVKPFFVLLIVACISTACGIPFLFLPAGPKVPPSESAKVQRLTFRKSLKLLLSNRNYILLVFVFSIGFCMYASIMAITNYIFTPYGYSNKDVGLASFVRIMSGVGDLVNTYAFMFVSCFLHGFFVFLIFPVSLELAAEVTFPVPEAVSASILCLFCQIGSFVTTYVLDALRDTSPTAHPPGNMKHALIYALVLSVCGAIPSVFLKRDLRRLHHDREGYPAEQQPSSQEEAIERNNDLLHEHQQQQNIASSPSENLHDILTTAKS